MNESKRTPSSKLIAIAELTEAEKRAMFALYRRHFDAADAERFDADLADKDQVLQIHDAHGMLCGFSTIALYTRVFEGQALRVLFSGDTIVDEASWGQQALAFAFVRLAGKLQAAAPEPLYWLLISKGHRTYRYLSAFSLDYDPSPEHPTSADRQRLMAFLAHDRFGSAYDAERGVVRYAQSHGHLRADLAEVPAIHAHLPEVAYFLERNPGFSRGEELVCLCAIHADNLRPMARRAFLSAQREARAGTMKHDERDHAVLL
jgi:hypothetical protein